MAKRRWFGGRYTSVQNSTLEGKVTVGHDSLVYDTTLDSLGSDIKIGDQVRLDNTTATGSIDIERLVSIFYSKLEGPVTVKKEVAICRRKDIKNTVVEKSLCN